MWDIALKTVGLVLGILILLAIYDLLTLITGDFIKVLALKLYRGLSNLGKPKAA
ncbi:MAG: hypothetical protein WCT08_02935 [Patescibacteria group bacterium]|jgi:hypothetical protein